MKHNTIDMPNKNLRTIKESSSGRNLKSKNIVTGKRSENKSLIKKAKAGKLPGYHVVKPKKGKEFLRSNPDKKSKNNLDPKIKK